LQSQFIFGSAFVLGAYLYQNQWQIKLPKQPESAVKNLLNVLAS
jgi:hypothetical protein